MLLRVIVSKSEKAARLAQGLLAHLKEFQSRLLDRDTVRMQNVCLILRWQIRGVQAAMSLLGHSRAVKPFALVSLLFSCWTSSQLTLQASQDATG